MDPVASIVEPLYGRDPVLERELEPIVEAYGVTTVFDGCKARLDGSVASLPLTGCAAVQALLFSGLPVGTRTVDPVDVVTQ